jgi:MFS family permease
MVAKDLQPAERIARARGQLLEGLRYVRNRPKLLLPVMMMGLIGVFGFNFQVTNALMAQGVFHRGAGGYGMLSTVQAVGSLAGALLAARRRQQPRARLIVGAAAAFAVFSTLSSFMPSYATFMVLLVPTGAAAILLSTAANTTLQLGAAPHMQGRVMALYTTVFVGSAPLGSMFVGWLGGVAGPRSALLFGGVICGMVALACAIFYLRAQRFEVTFDDRLWRPHVVSGSGGVRLVGLRVRSGSELGKEALVADSSAR